MAPVYHAQGTMSGKRPIRREPWIYLVPQTAPQTLLWLFQKWGSWHTTHDTWRGVDVMGAKA